MTRSLKNLHLRFAMAAALAALWSGMVGSLEIEPEVTTAADTGCAVAAAARATAQAC